MMVNNTTTNTSIASSSSSSSSSHYGEVIVQKVPEPKTIHHPQSPTATDNSSSSIADFNSSKETSKRSTKIDNSGNNNNNNNNHKKQQQEPTISYVTSFWAQPPSPESAQSERPVGKGSNNETTATTTVASTTTTASAHPHRKEIQAAMLANINNPYFHQTVILLDGVSNQANCSHFVQEMKQLQHRFASATNTNSTITVDQYFHNKVNCVNIQGGQPTYFQMFNYSLNPTIVRGDIVVLSNADHVFDDTISKIPRMMNHPKYNTPPSSTTNWTTLIMTLSSRGYSPETVPKYVQEYHTHFITKQDRTHTTEVDHCSPTLKRPKTSWDTYIFRPDDFRYSSSSSSSFGKYNNDHNSNNDTSSYDHSQQRLVIHEDDFKRPKLNGTMTPYYMNEMGGENAALYDLLYSINNNNTTTKLMLHRNGCRHINSWHFHLTKKMHKDTYIDEDTKWTNVTKRKADRVPRPAVEKTKFY